MFSVGLNPLAELRLRKADCHKDLPPARLPRCSAHNSGSSRASLRLHGHRTGTSRPSSLPKRGGSVSRGSSPLRDPKGRLLRASSRGGGGSILLFLDLQAKLPDFSRHLGKNRMMGAAGLSWLYTEQIINILFRVERWPQRSLKLDGVRLGVSACNRRSLESWEGGKQAKEEEMEAAETES